MPEIKIQSEKDNDIRARDEKAKEKMKKNADKRNVVRNPTIFKPGDMVLMKKPKENKLSASYYAEPTKVTNVKGTMVTTHNEKLGTKTRNASHFKLFQKRSRMETYAQTGSRDHESQKSMCEGGGDASKQVQGHGANNKRPVREKQAPSKYRDFVM